MHLSPATLPLLLQSIWQWPWPHHTPSSSLPSSSISLTNYNNIPTKTIFEFTQPLSAENLVERTNGNILISVQGGPNLYEINPHSTQSGRIIHSFEGHANVFGIAEGDEDLWYVLLGNYTHAPTWTGIPGSNALYLVDLRGCAPVVTKVFDVVEAYTLDGLVTLNREKGLYVAGDTQTGTLYLFDVKAGSYAAVYQSPLLNQTAEHFDVQLDRVGINGVKYYDGDLYFTVTSQHAFGRVPFDKDTGKPTGDAVHLTHFEHHPDDFSISGTGVAVITILEQGFVVVDLKDETKSKVLAEPLLDYFGANAALWGRNEETRCTLYATYNLGVVSKNTASGLIALDMTGLGLTEGC